MEVELEKMSIKELEGVIDRYPWFTLARRELFLKMAEMGDDHKKMGIRRVAGYVYSRERLLKDIDRSVLTGKQDTVEESNESFVFELDFEEVKRDLPEIKSERVDKQERVREVFVVGGDYFRREDFESIDNEGKEFMGRISPITIRAERERSTNDERERISPIDGASEIGDDDLFYTESLAGVYASQGFYKRAIDIYEKLILLYPEKNSYFASLIKEVKKKL